MATKKLSATVKRNSLPRCWVKEGGKYILTAKGGKTIRQSLPYVGIRFEQLLKDLNIPYEVVQLPDFNNPGQLYTACAFWNPELYEVENQLLPVYQQVQNSKDVFVNTGEMYEGATFTYEMISQAIKVKKVVMQAVESQKAFVKAVADCKRANKRKTSTLTKVDKEFLNKALDGKTAKVVKIANAEIDNEVNSGNIKILPAYDSEGKRNGYYGIFDMSKLEYVPAIKLLVPGKEAGKIYGKEKQNLQYWEYCCGKEIQIIPIKR